ncbi:MAG: ParA family protein [Rhodospirillaceae bacterium]|nr:ParA family protein [Rhodospirillaceae bacterium]
MNVVAVFNQKGGVGKTTISVNLAVTLASMGYKTVFIDMDFQGDGTRQLWHGAPPNLTVYDLLARRCCAEEAAVETGFANLSVVASSRKLSLIEAGSDTAGWRQTELKDNGFTRSQVDFVVIDCPPSLGRLAANALTAANFLIVPVTPTAFAIEGMRRTLDIYQAVRAGLNPDLRHYRICLSMMDDKPVSRVLAAEIVSAQGEHLMPTKVPFDADVNKAATYKTPTVLYNPESDFSAALASLAVDMIGTLGIDLSDAAIEHMRKTIDAKHQELAPGFKGIAELNVETARPVPALVPPAATHMNGHAKEATTPRSRFKPFVVGSLIGAALGFFAGAHM